MFAIAKYILHVSISLDETVGGKKKPPVVHVEKKKRTGNNNNDDEKKQLVCVCVCGCVCHAAIIVFMDGRVPQWLRLGHIQNICMMNTLIQGPYEFALSDREKKKSEIKTSIWRPSSQTAGCIKGPVCLFHMDPVTFPRPRTGRTHTNSVPALERHVQSCEKVWGVYRGR